jgi:teichuronic acid biosynthesis glycosyltransferase TuaH
VNPRDPIVWIAGVGWDDTPGTDRHLVRAVARRHPVLWVDPPRRESGARPAPHARTEDVADGVTRLSVPALPGATRWPITALIDARRGVALARWGGRAGAVVVSNPLARFPHAPGAPRILYVTDDWIAGAGLMGLSRTLVRRTLAANAWRADAVAAVTEPLIAQARSLALVGTTRVIPNGAPVLEPVHARRGTAAGVVGQLNERLDLDLLERVADAGTPLRLIGPWTGRDDAFRRRLDALAARPGVVWTGRLDAADLRVELATLGVGLTPYVDSAFNRASFPLKTLEYLAAGVPVVSTDLPASRWIGSAHVDVAGPPAAFVAAVARASVRSARGDEVGERERVALARTHGWEARANELLTLVDEVRPAYAQGTIRMAGGRR